MVEILLEGEIIALCTMWRSGQTRLRTQHPWQWSLPVAKQHLALSVIPKHQGSEEITYAPSIHI